MKIQITTLTELLTKAAQKFVSNEQAQYFARELVDTYLKKHPRSNPLKGAVKDITSWGVEDSAVEKKVDKAGATIYDFGGKAPALYAKNIHEELVSKARNNGIALAGVVNSAGFHTLTFWTDALARQGVVSICIVNGGPAVVVPFGARGGKDQAVFGTNPVSYAIPTQSTPISADMATSEVPFFDIVAAKKGETSLHDRAVLKESGETTGDINQSYFEGEEANIAPLGVGHRGSALALLFEVLTSSLLGAPNSREMNRERFIAQEHGNLILAFDIESFTQKSKFEKSTQNLAHIIANLQPTDESKGVRYPGQKSFEKLKQRNQASEVDVDEELIAQLKDAAQ